MQDVSKLVYEYKMVFLRTNFSNVRLMYNVASNLYDAMILQYEYCESINNVKQQHRICELADTVIMPKLREAILKTKSESLANDLHALHKLYFALSSRRILKNFALYIEQYKNKKVWDKTMETVETMFYYADIFAISDKLNMMRASLMPSMGKSYFGNLFVAQSCGNNPNIQILRITYADDLCITTTNQTRAIINSKAFREIFPRYQKYQGDNIFRSATKYHFCMADSEDEYNLFAVTREGQSTGKRAHILMIDDLLKDDSESYNKTLHKKMVDRYESTWSSRADGDNLKVMLLGTMWADTDLLNVMYDRALEDDELVPSDKYKYTELTKTGTAVFIGIPALDENDESTCPKRYSSLALKKKRSHMSRFLWMCVYQQDPISPEGLEFDWANLQQWDTFPEVTKDVVRYASLDPARKGKNYVSMPILYKYDDLYYVKDWLYKKKSMDELYEDIADKIVEHQLSYLVVENNTDTSLKYVIEEKLKQRRYFGCTIIEKFSSQNKEQRIKDNQGYIRNNIVYPKKGLYSSNTDMGKAMDDLTAFSFEYPNKFDDSPDSVGLFVMEFVKESGKPARVQTFNRYTLGI